MIFEAEGQAQLILISTGSEVELAVKVAKEMANKGISIRVVSMPSTNVFEEQSAEYRESVLPSNISKRIAIEAGSTDGWWKYVGLEGKIIGLDRFGESAPASDLFKEFGFTVENLMDKVEAMLR